MQTMRRPPVAWEEIEAGADLPADASVGGGPVFGPTDMDSVETDGSDRPTGADVVAVPWGRSTGPAPSPVSTSTVAPGPACRSKALRMNRESPMTTAPIKAIPPVNIS